MPRDPSKIYYPPNGTLAVTQTPISSAAYNNYVADMTADANNPRPVIAGGTGGATAAEGRQNIGAGATAGIVDKAAGTYTAAKSDHNYTWRATGAVTVNLTAAATLTAGWCMWVKGDGGAITVDPNGSEQINGATTLTLPDGVSALVICTGSAFRAVVFGDVSLSGTQTLTNKTLTTPTLTLKQSASPAPTAEGDIQWDTDDNRLVIGDGAGQKTFSDDSKLLPLTGGTLTGAVSGITPTNAAHLTRKDYVDGQDIGIGQSWQSVTRSVATSYQNTTGKPIMVNVSANGSSAAGNFQVSPDNSTWVTVGLIYSNAQDVRAAEAVIPAGHYYKLTGGTATWVELR